MIACPSTSTCPHGGRTVADCTCAAGNELVDDVCVSSCLAPPGSFCAPSRSAGGTVLVSQACPPGYYCPGGRGADKTICPAGFGCPGVTRYLRAL